MPMGRPKTSEGPTTEVSVVVPSAATRILRVLAVERGRKRSQLVKLLEAVERGRGAFADGNYVTHEEAGRRLRKRRTR